MIAREPISRLAETLRRIRSGGDRAAQVVQWLRACNDAAAEIPVPESRDPNRKYSRTLLFKNDLFEVLALHWQPNATSSIHDHGGALCWLTVARGEMSIENYVRKDSGGTPGYATIGLEGREELQSGAIDHRQDDVHLHRCVARDGGTVTLHVYAHPIERFHAFDQGGNACYEVTSTYDAIAAW